MITEFTPIQSLIGGMLIGVSAVFLMASVGRIAGISGIVSKLLIRGDHTNRYKSGTAFVIGMLIAAPLYNAFSGSLPFQFISSNTTLLIIAGLLVGVGSTIGNGCTSGHGVCGISRGSGRSIIATITFMITAFVTVYILNHVIGA